MMSLVVVLAGGCLVLAMLWRREAALRAVAERRGFEEQANLRDQRERELKEQGQRTSALFDRMVEGIIVADATGRVLLSNRAAGSLFSMAGSPQGKTILEATRHHEVAAVDSDRGALMLAGADQPDDPLLRFAGDHRPHLAGSVPAG